MCVSSNGEKSTNAAGVNVRQSSRKTFIRNAMCVYLHFLPNRQKQTIHE